MSPGALAELVQDTFAKATSLPHSYWFGLAVTFVGLFAILIFYARRR